MCPDDISIYPGQSQANDETCVQVFSGSVTRHGALTCSYASPRAPIRPSAAEHRLDGTWEKILDALRAGCDEAEGKDWTVSADSTIARAHQHAAGARRTPAVDAP